MKKIVVSVLFALLLLTAFTSKARADAINPSLEENADCYDDYRKEGVAAACVNTAHTVASDYNYLSCLMGETRACSNDPEQQSMFFQNSVMGKVSSGIAYMYINRPADTRQFIAYYKSKIGLATPAYAQGIGFAGLSPMLPIWRAFRNVAYGFLIIIMVVVGFMVLFRMKIDPRTVISVQSAIPRIITTLILITFSYAIVGLLIDVMYLLIFLALATFRSAIRFENFPLAISHFTGGSLGNLFGAVWTPGTAAIDDITQLIGGSNADAITAVILGVVGAIIGGSFGLIGGAVGAFVGSGASGVASATGHNALVTLLVWLALVFTFVRILFLLLNAYVSVIVSLIFGPLQLMFGAIPNTDAFGSWIRNLAANLLVFPVTVTMLLLAQILSAVASKSPNFWSAPGLGGGFNSGVAGLIGLGILFMIPNVANSLKEMLKAKPIVPSGTGAIFTPITSVYGTATQGLSTMYYLKGMNPLQGLADRLKKP